jgi:hypothetical protein
MLALRTASWRGLATKATGVGVYGLNDLYDNSRIPTYAFQDSIPRLPIPKLDDTLNKWGCARGGLPLPQGARTQPPGPPAVSTALAGLVSLYTSHVFLLRALRFSPVWVGMGC